MSLRVEIQMNDILISDDVQNTLKEIIPLCKSDLNVISGFCKLHTLEFIDKLVSNPISKKLLVRFLPSDITSGATDKEIYSYCKNHNWSIYIDYSIHAKTYVFDKIKCIIGSANLTDKGLGILNKSNKEASVCFELDNSSYLKILSLYRDAILLDDKLYNFVISQNDDIEVVNYKNQYKSLYSISCLFPEDFPSENSDLIELYSSRSFKWLVNYLSSKESKLAYFGELSAAIHNIFVKDPRPYRKNIKQHLGDLLKCIQFCHVDAIEITRPNYSECVKLK